MWKLGKGSQVQYETLSPSLKVWIDALLFGPVDFTLIKGFRPEDEQNKAVAEGKSQTPWPLSEHNKYPSEAVDIMPYYWDVEGGIDWRSDEHIYKAINVLIELNANKLNVSSEYYELTTTASMKEVAEVLEVIKRRKFFIGYAQALADNMGIGIRNGSDWDKDGRFDDQKFVDSPHWETYEEGR